MGLMIMGWSTKFKEVTTVKDIEDVTNEGILLWVQRVGVQRVQNQPLIK